MIVQVFCWHVSLLIGCVHRECVQIGYKTSTIVKHITLDRMNASPDPEILCSQAIKNKKPNTVQCDADEIDIYLQQEASSSVLPIRCK